MSNDQPKTLHPIDELARHLIDNSRRWFPHIAARGHHAERCHYALGLAGELGETLSSTDDEYIVEIADVATYALELAWAFGFIVGHDLPSEIVDANDDMLEIVTLGCYVVDRFKKLDAQPGAADEVGDTDDSHSVIAEHLIRLIAHCAVQAGGAAELYDAILAKQAICERRWG